MFENLRKLYRHYGGVATILRSYYFWLSVILTALSYRSIANNDWSSTTLSVMPSLTGFTVAAFAIIFAILSPDMLRKLMAPDSDGRSPIAAIAASIGHAVFIQVSALILATSSKHVTLHAFIEFLTTRAGAEDGLTSLILEAYEWLRLLFSALGLFTTYYGVMLVLAAILSIFRMQLIVVSTTKSKSPGPRP